MNDEIEDEDPRVRLFEQITIIESDGSERRMDADNIKAMISSLDNLDARGDNWTSVAPRLEAALGNLEVTSFGGYVPIQGEGTFTSGEYAGHGFYFRARYQTATLSVGTYDDDPDQVSYWNPRWQASIRVTDDPYGAGYMTPDETVAAFLLLFGQLKPVTREDNQEQMDAFTKSVEDMVAMMKQGDEIRSLDTTEEE